MNNTYRRLISLRRALAPAVPDTPELPTSMISVRGRTPIFSARRWQKLADPGRPCSKDGFEISVSAGFGKVYNF